MKIGPCQSADSGIHPTQLTCGNQSVSVPLHVGEGEEGEVGTHDPAGFETVVRFLFKKY